MKLDIKALLAEHPNLHIHFHERGAWMIFRDKAACDAFDEISNRDGLIADGDDYDAEGYLPTIVASLARAIGITVDSI